MLVIAIQLKPILAARLSGSDIRSDDLATIFIACPTAGPIQVEMIPEINVVRKLLRRQINNLQLR